ncbi:MAG TPA: DUF433 domain-containing protein [Candidatus Omnitrophota bacterium]|nr:DUF433 domain-containing protein [Candidatus Omnitrophota bacterium]
MHEERIVVDPEICFGKPCIKETRIPVYMILELIEQGLTTKEIIKQCYPDITPADIKACIHYAAGILKNEEISIQEVA